jgi:transcriptional regulator with XRE-family HTH domain
MSPQEIKALLILNGVKQRELAKQLHVNESAISLIINGRQTSRRIQTAIAEAINKPYHEVWPGEINENIS